MDSSAQCLVSTLTSTLRQTVHTGSPAPPAASSQLQAPHGNQSARYGQENNDEATTCGDAGAQQLCCSTACQSEAELGGETDMLATLRDVLQGCDMPPTTPEPPGTADDVDGTASSSDSSWSGDEVMQSASETLRGLAGGTHNGRGSVTFHIADVPEPAGMGFSWIVQDLSCASSQ